MISEKVDEHEVKIEELMMLYNYLSTHKNNSLSIDENIVEFVKSEIDEIIEMLDDLPLSTAIEEIKRVKNINDQKIQRFQKSKLFSSVPVKLIGNAKAYHYALDILER